MAMHEKLSADLNMDIFFCDPHSPWQRGSNENANGLVREYLGRLKVEVRHLASCKASRKWEFTTRI
jgi:IS30 family transposase